MRRMSKAKIDPERLRERMTAVGRDPDKGGQTWLAKQTGMTQQGVQSILVGKSARPTRLREIARAVATSEAYLLRQTDDPTPEISPERNLLRALIAFGFDETQAEVAYGIVAAFKERTVAGQSTQSLGRDLHQRTSSHHE